MTTIRLLLVILLLPALAEARCAKGKWPIDDENARADSTEILSGVLTEECAGPKCPGCFCQKDLEERTGLTDAEIRECKAHSKPHDPPGKGRADKLLHGKKNGQQ